MKQASVKILLSLAAAGLAGFLTFVLLEATLAGSRALSGSAALFRFQVSSMIAMSIFAGVAIVMYVRLSRSRLNVGPGSEASKRLRLKK